MNTPRRQLFNTMLPILALAVALVSGCHYFENAGDHPFPESDQDLGDVDASGDLDLADIPPDLDQIGPDVPDADADGGDIADGGECTGDQDCECGQTCVDMRCAGCRDCDGDGFGDGCDPGADCNDQNPTIFPFALSECSISDQLGICASGTRICLESGEFSACSGSTPWPFEICNGEDDDCDGDTDEDLPRPTCLGACSVGTGCSDGSPVTSCTSPLADTDDCVGNPGVDDDCNGIVDDYCPASCLYVSPEGDGTGSSWSDPMAFDESLNLAGSQRICLLAREGCQIETYYLTGNLTLPANMELSGSYNSTTGALCPGRPATLALGSTPGLRIAQSGVSISGVTIQRPDVSPNTYVAIEVDGVDTTLSNIALMGHQEEVSISKGIHVVNRGHVTVIGSLITGAASQNDIGIHTVGATADILDNCAGSGGPGTCSTTCSNVDSLQTGIRLTGASGTSTAILLEGAGDSRVERSLICVAAPTSADGILLQGEISCPDDNCDTPMVMGNTIELATATTGAGIEARDLSGSARFVNNNVAVTTSRGVGIDVAASVASVSGNSVVSSSNNGGGAQYTGIQCRNLNEELPNCFIFANQIQLGASDAATTGIRCANRGDEVGPVCPFIAANAVYGGVSPQPTALVLDNVKTFVLNNGFLGGCATGAVHAVGVDSSNSTTAMRNNFVVGSGCSNNGIGMVLTPGMADLPAVLDSNSITGGGSAEGETCDDSVGLLIQNLFQATSAGLATNNIIDGGLCATSVAIDQSGGVLPGLSANALVDRNQQYYRQGQTVLTDLQAIPGTLNPNFTCNPAWLAPQSGDLHLGNTSDCVGLAASAPENDIDGRPRDEDPDVGADELSNND